MGDGAYSKTIPTPLRVLRGHASGTAHMGVRNLVMALLLGGGIGVAWGQLAESASTPVDPYAASPATPPAPTTVVVPPPVAKSPEPVPTTVPGHTKLRGRLVQITPEQIVVREEGTKTEKTIPRGEQKLEGWVVGDTVVVTMDAQGKVVGVAVEKPVSTANPQTQTPTPGSTAPDPTKNTSADVPSAGHSSRAN